MKKTPKTTPSPDPRNAGAGLPRSQGRRGGSNGVQRTDASRAEPGLSLCPEEFARTRAPLRLNLMSEELQLLKDMMAAYPDQISKTAVHFGIYDIEEQCRLVRQTLIPKLKDDFRPCLAQLLDVRA